MNLNSFFLSDKKLYLEEYVKVNLKKIPFFFSDKF